MSGFRLIPHTSEIGLSVRARSLPVLFQNAALGLLKVYGVRGPKVALHKSWRIRVRGRDVEELLVRWLGEMITQISVRRRLYGRVRVARVWPSKEAQGTLSGERLITGRHRLGREVKSATYHGLKVEKQKGFFRAKVIFDV